MSECACVRACAVSCMRTRERASVREGLRESAREQASERERVRGDEYIPVGTRTSAHLKDTQIWTRATYISWPLSLTLHPPLSLSISLYTLLPLSLFLLPSPSRIQPIFTITSASAFRAAANLSLRSSALVALSLAPPPP